MMHIKLNWLAKKYKDRACFQLEDIQHPPIALVPIEKNLEWISGQLPMEFEYLSNPKVQTVILRKMDDEYVIELWVYFVFLCDFGQ